MMSKDQHMLAALDYIDRNIAQNISLYDIARESGFSVPHFYRLFKRLTGDTAGAYLLRRRISLAARDLTSGGKTITSIALEYGFESHDVFTRAFTRVYGMSPSRYRRESPPPPMKKLPLTESGSGGENHQMKFSLMHMGGFFVIGMACDAVTWDRDGSVGRLWSSFLQRAEEIKQVSSPINMYGICEHEICGADTIRYIASIGVGEAAEAPPGMIKRYVREQDFVKANVPDSISTPDAYAGTVGFAKSLGYEIDTYDTIEVYEEFFQDPEFNSFKLLIPVKTAPAVQRFLEEEHV
jgi:AraC family transcriptional regulator